MTGIEGKEMNALVGYTGFVGSNLLSEHAFDALYNSSNITEAFDTHPALLVYCGVPAEKFLANRSPEKDADVIENAFSNIRRIGPAEVVLISTADVYPLPVGVDEDAHIDETALMPYGKNRKELENRVEAYYEKRLVVRLPALYGANIKKNFIYDFIHRIPSRLSEGRFRELASRKSEIEFFYETENNGFFKCRDLTSDESASLKNILHDLDFSALVFTDSRAEFQFYNLKWLWRHIQTAREHGIRKLNLATEPFTAGELFLHLTGEPFDNELNAPIPKYDFRTKYSRLFEGANGYIKGKQEVKDDIRLFLSSHYGVNS